MKRDNKIIVDLSKVQHARFGYKNQYGQWSDTKPEYSLRGSPISGNEMCYDKNLELVNAINYTIKKNLVDIWHPVVILKLTANESLEYTGDRAISIYKEFCGRVFNKKKGK